MNANEFVDFYELMQLSPNADTDTIERMFRHLAKKTHPDSSEFADNEKFQLIVEAHRTLSDPETRAGYDARYQDYWDRKWKLASQTGDRSTFGEDQIIRERLLSLLYVQRRRNMDNPGLGELVIARLLHIPPELIQFHLWYLKAKGWVERLQTGHLAVTAEGVDQVEQGQFRVMPDRLLEAHVPLNEDTERNEDGNKEMNLLDSE